MTLKVADSGESLRELFDSYEVADLSDLKIGPELVNETQGRLTILLRRVIEAESPVHVDLVVERLRARYGHGRAGRQIRERILNAVFDVVRREYAWEGGQSAERRKLPSRPFIVEEDSVVRPRVPGAGQSARPIVRICDAELEAGILAVLTAIIGDTEESLIRNVSLAFGFKRVGADIRSAVGGAITRLLARGDLKTAGEMIELA